MGIAVISGVLASLDPQPFSSINGLAKWESHTPGTQTPVAEPSDPAVPARFIACVSQPESARKLKQTFGALGGRGSAVEVYAGQNLEAVKQADVVLLWCVPSLRPKLDGER